MAQKVKRLPTMRETRVRSLGQEHPPGEGNGNPLQYSCLEIPWMEEPGGSTVHGVAKSWTQLSDFTLFLGPLLRQRGSSWKKFHIQSVNPVVGYWWELLVTGTNIFGTGTSISRDNIFLLSSNRCDSWHGPLTLQDQRKRADHCSPLEGAIP